MERIKNYFEQKIIFLLKFLYSWMSTDLEILGYILGIIHVIGSVSIIVMAIVSHTLYPAFWLKCVMFAILFVIWLQHILLKICIVFTTEYILTKSEAPFYTLINFFTNLNTKDWVSHFIVAETMAVGCFGLEILSVLITYFYRKIGVNF